jgi:hypothetical protein
LAILSLIEYSNGRTAENLLIYPLKSIVTAKNDDLFRLGPVLMMGDNYPHNDIFIGLNSKKQMYIEVMEK